MGFLSKCHKHSDVFREHQMSNTKLFPRELIKHHTTNQNSAFPSFYLASFWQAPISQHALIQSLPSCRAIVDISEDNDVTLAWFWQSMLHLEHKSTWPSLFPSLDNQWWLRITQRVDIASSFCYLQCCLCVCTNHTAGQLDLMTVSSESDNVFFWILCDNITQLMYCSWFFLLISLTWTVQRWKQHCQAFLTTAKIPTCYQKRLC